MFNFRNLVPDKMQPEVKELFWSSLIMNFTLAMVLIYEPIFLFKIGFSLAQIMLFFLAVYVFYVLLNPLGAAFAARHGYEVSIFISTIFLIGYYLSLFLLPQFSWLVILTPVIYALQKAFYWPSYHADFAKFSTPKFQGREISLMLVLISVVYIIGPVLGGLLITWGGFKLLFIIASVLFLLSNAPLLVTKEVFKPRAFAYKDVFLKMIDKKTRKAFWSYVGYGEELVFMVIWPIFISLIIVSYFSIGLVMTLATLLTIIITFCLGKMSDIGDKRKMLKTGASISLLSWFLRILMVTPLGVFLMDSLSRISKNIISVPMMAITYKNARDHKVLSTTTFYESSLGVGKIIACLVIYLFILIIGHEDMAVYYFSFILAGGMSLLYALL
jgi:MFS family permease